MVTITSMITSLSSQWPSSMTSTPSYLVTMLLTMDSFIVNLLTYILLIIKVGIIQYKRDRELLGIDMRGEGCIISL